MRLETLWIFGLVFLLFSCGHQSDQERKSHTESVSENDDFNTTTKNLNQQTSASYQEELNKALADTSVADYYKVIYRQEKLISADDNKILSITKQLFTEDPDKDLFYFIVFTKSMNGSDGFYSEAVGLSSFEYITTKTERFAQYFLYAPKLTDKDLENWAQYVFGEIQISRENEEKQAVKELESQLYDNIKEAGKEYRVIIEKFIDKIKSTMP